MRLKLGRPDLRDYTRYFTVPDASAEAPLTVTWAGVTTLLVDDGSSALMTDGFFSRPGLATVGLRQIAPSAPRIDGSLERLGVDRLEAVLPVHTHFDHAMDSAVVAQRTDLVDHVGGEIGGRHVDEAPAEPDEVAVANLRADPDVLFRGFRAAVAQRRRVARVEPARDVGAGDHAEHRVVVSELPRPKALPEVGVEFDGGHAARLVAGWSCEPTTA